MESCRVLPLLQGEASPTLGGLQEDMEAPLTHGELREELTRFLHSELKQVFEQVVHSQLRQEFRPHIVAPDNDNDVVKIRPRVFNKKRLSTLTWSQPSYAPLSEQQQSPRNIEQGDIGRIKEVRDEERFKKKPTMLRLHDLQEIEQLIEHESEMNQNLPHEYLYAVTGVMVVLNAACLGWETNHRLQHGDVLPAIFNLLESAFCIFFVLEISLRIACRCHNFFCGEEKYWNLFDFAVVALQVLERITCHAKALRILRLLRIFRVIRLVRVLHLFEELHFIAASISKTISVVFWFCLLLFLVVYLFSILILELLLADGNARHDYDNMSQWFGSVPRTLLTMFGSIAGGFDWESCADLLMVKAPYACFVFMLYILVTMLAVLNMLTGLFVEHSMHMAKEEKDFHLAARINNLLLKNCQVKEVDFSTFQDLMQDQTMLDYMDELGLSAHECEDLFSLLDEDHSGTINSDEIVNGCLRLRGQARALDLALVMREINTLKLLLTRGTLRGPQDTARGVQAGRSTRVTL